MKQNAFKTSIFIRNANLCEMRLIIHSIIIKISNYTTFHVLINVVNVSRKGEREGRSREKRIVGAKLNPDGNINFDCNIKSSVVKELIIFVERLFWSFATPM